jgi:hypothetical protein
MRNEELHNLYTSPSIIRMVKSRKMRLAGHVGLVGRRGMHMRLLVGKPEGRRLLGRQIYRWVNNIKVDLRDGMGWYGLDWSGSG